ncbi:UbiA family prenyltransferase [Streptomyces sp. COG19]|nr:UbiA family prenyltransferase [Streptomyces sp. COG19]
MSQVLVSPSSPAPVPTDPGHLRPVARTVRDCLREARPLVQVMFVLRFVTGALLTASAAHHRVDLLHLLLGAVAWWAATVSVYIFNGVSDLREDRANRSERPLASGQLGESAARRAVALTALAGLVFGCAAGWEVAESAAVFLVLGYVYSAPSIAAKCRSWSASAVTCAAAGTTYLAGVAASGSALTTEGRRLRRGPLARRGADSRRRQGPGQHPGRLPRRAAHPGRRPGRAQRPAVLRLLRSGADPDPHGGCGVGTGAAAGGRGGRLRRGGPVRGRALPRRTEGPAPGPVPELDGHPVRRPSHRAGRASVDLSAWAWGRPGRPRGLRGRGAEGAVSPVGALCVPYGGNVPYLGHIVIFEVRCYDPAGRVSVGNHAVRPPDRPFPR